MRMQWLCEHGRAGVGEWPGMHTFCVWGLYTFIHTPVNFSVTSSRPLRHYIGQLLQACTPASEKRQVIWTDWRAVCTGDHRNCKIQMLWRLLHGPFQCCQGVVSNIVLLIYFYQIYYTFAYLHAAQACLTRTYIHLSCPHLSIHLFSMVSDTDMFI